LKVQTTATIEFDGMIRFDAEMVPQEAADTSKLQLVIPLREEHASHIGMTMSKSAGDPKGHFYGRLSNLGRRHGQFHPFIWLGDTNRGILWFAESARNWRLQSGNRAYEFVTDGQRVELILNLIDHSVRIKEPIACTFGLQASPVRPRPKHWRRFSQEHWGTFPTTSEKFGFIPHALRKRSDALKKKVTEKKPIIPYTLVDHVSTALPEYNLLFDDWKKESSQKRGRHYIDRVDPSARSWQDFLLWSFSESLKMAPLDGLYYDLVWPQPTNSIEKGAFKDAKGRTQPHWPIFAVREIARRAYIHFRSELGRETAFVGHCSAHGIVLPVLSFCDMLLEGEQISGRVNDYVEQMPAGYSQIGLSGKALGAPVMLHPQLARSGNQNYNHLTPKPTEEMMAMVLLHDALSSPVFTHGKTRTLIENIRQEFCKSADVSFLPYWMSKGSVSSSSRSVLISAYLKADSLLLVVFNTSREAVECNAGFAGGIVTRIRGKSKLNDALTGEEFSVENSAVAVSLDGRQLMLLRPVKAQR
jgi:hypothetical protein